MKIATIITRYLLGLIFLVFGSNVFFHFIQMPPPPEGPARDFIMALFMSHYIYVVGALQVACGLLLLSDRSTPLALALVGPVIVNVLCYHAFMAPAGLPLAIVVSVLALFLLWRYRGNFAGLLIKAPAKVDSRSQQPATRTLPAHS